MYEAHFGLSEKPFSLLPDPSFLYLGETHSMAYTMFEYGILNNVGISVITGEIGSGKTTLVRHLLNQLDHRTTVGLISNTHHTFGGLFEWVLMAFGLDYKDKSKTELYETFLEHVISEYSKGQRTILIVDEAQNMDVSALEDLRLMSNINADKDQLLQLVLVGQPGLRNTLKVPELVQFAHRVGVDFHVGPMDLSDTRRYIEHRMAVAGSTAKVFDDSASELIHTYSGGIPRLINLLSDAALVYAYGSDEHVVTAELVDEVVQDKRSGGLLEFRAKGPTTAKRPTVAVDNDPSPPHAVTSGPGAAEPERLADATSWQADDFDAYRDLFAALRKD